METSVEQLTLQQNQQSKIEKRKTQKKQFKSFQDNQIYSTKPQQKKWRFFKFFKHEIREVQCGDICICLKQLGLISKRAPYKPLNLPSLPPLTGSEVQELQKMMSKNTAITKTVYRKHTSNKPKIMFYYRIYGRIALQKLIFIWVRLGQFLQQELSRYLKLQLIQTNCCNVSSFQIIESRFAKRLKDNIFNNLKFNQTGFCPGKGNQDNIIQLIEQIQRIQKNQQQGSLISPSLFNFQLDEFRIEFSQNFNEWFNVRACADDLVFIVKHSNMTKFLKILGMIAKQ